MIVVINPREWSNIATMMCDHGRYRLGDKKWSDVMGSDIHPSIEAWEEYADKQRIIWLPLYLYDHSGITMATTPFSCPWDSGRVGFIFVTREDVIKEYGSFRKTAQAKAIKRMRQEVEIYDQYLRGAVWVYIIKDQDGDVHESCGGMYGEDYCRKEGENMLASIKNRISKITSSFAII